MEQGQEVSRLLLPADQDRPEAVHPTVCPRYFPPFLVGRNRNVAAAVDPPRAIAPEITPLSPAQTSTLLQAAKGNRLEALYVLAVTTGMRQGEILGLGW